MLAFGDQRVHHIFAELARELKKLLIAGRVGRGCFDWLISATAGHGRKGQWHRYASGKR